MPGLSPTHPAPPKKSHEAGTQQSGEEEGKPKDMENSMRWICVEHSAQGPALGKCSLNHDDGRDGG